MDEHLKPCGNHSCEECYPELIETEYDPVYMDRKNKNKKKRKKEKKDE